MAIRLLLVDDHAVVRSGLRMLLEGEADVEIAGEAGTAREALDLLARLHPDVVLMDIGLPDLSGIDATREIKSLYPEIAIVALTIHEDEEYFFKMLEAGASRYVPKRAAPEEFLRVNPQFASELLLREPTNLSLPHKFSLTQESTSR